MEGGTNVTWKIGAVPQKYFLRLLELAKSSHVGVTMIMLPEYFSAMERQLNRREITDYYTSVAVSNSIPFLRFDDDDICRQKSKFYNPNHLNRIGAMEVSESLAERLSAMNVPQQ